MISVHAISMIYELRALRSRLDVMLAHPGLFQEEEKLIWMWNVVNNLINKTERTGDYIASLEQAIEDAGPLPGEAEADLGEERVDLDRDR